MIEWLIGDNNSNHNGLVHDLMLVRRCILILLIFVIVKKCKGGRILLVVFIVDASANGPSLCSIYFRMSVR